MTKDKPRTKSLSDNLPWLDRDAGLDEAVGRLVSQLVHTKTKREAAAEIDKKTERRLQRSYKDAEQGRSPATKFMRALAKEMGMEDPEGSYVVAPMKAWNRIVDKFNAAAKDVQDLGRGSIYIRDYSEYQAFHKLMKAKTRDGCVTPLKQDCTRIIEGSMDDYLAHPRKSGYAGSINFNLEMDLNKGRQGIFEVQIRPYGYQDIDKKSHRLYDMIRILQEVPKNYLNDKDKEVIKALITANRALFEEQSWRLGFDKALQGKPQSISEQERDQVMGVLDRVRTALELLPGRNFSWKSETADALTYAKTSVMNVHMANKRGPAPTLDMDAELS